MAPFHKRRTVFLNESTTWTRALASTGIMMHDLKPVEPDLTEYEACASSGPPNNLERFRAARRRGVPEITFRVDTKVQEVYETANAAAFAVLTEYAKQVEGLTEHAKDLVSRPAVGLPRVVISTAASMTAAQIDATIHCVVPSRHNAVAKVLALRNSHGAGLLPTESYDVVHPNVFKTSPSTPPHPPNSPHPRPHSDSPGRAQILSGPCPLPHQPSSPPPHLPFFISHHHHHLTSHSLPGPVLLLASGHRWVRLHSPPLPLHPPCGRVELACGCAP